MPGPCPDVTLAIASLRRLTKPVADRRRPPRRIFDTGLGSGEPLRIEIGIGGRRVGAGTERSEEFVESRHSPAEIGGRADAEATAQRHDGTAASRGQPALALGVMIVAGHLARREQPFNKVTSSHVPMVDAGPPGQRDGAQVRRCFTECSCRQRVSTRLAPPGRIAIDKTVELARFTIGMAGIHAEAELDALRHRWAHLDAAAEAVRRHGSCSETWLAVVRPGPTLAKLLIRLRACQ